MRTYEHAAMRWAVVGDRGFEMRGLRGAAIVVVGLVAIACERRGEAPGSVAVPVTSTTAAPTDPVSPGPGVPPVGSAAPVLPPAPEIPPASPEPAGVAEAVTPAPVSEAPVQPLTRTRVWPFVAWDRAEAIGFNHVAYGPGVPLRAYAEATGWSPKIVERRAISREQGARAVEWVVATRGEIEVSKCAFPRHAVVLYAGATPVGSVNVCFECGDILVWPEFEPPPAEDTSAGYERRFRRQMAGYKRVFPQWERFFRDELGLPLAPVLGP